MRKIGKVDIVGTPYTIYLYEEGEFKALQDDAKERDERYLQPAKEGALDGYCDYMSKEIRIYNDSFTDIKYFEMTLRHEISHAFLYEIGNSNYDNEEFVDKLSKWVPQIAYIFQRAEACLRIKKALGDVDA